MEEREHQKAGDEVQLPAEHVEDLEPDAEEARDVSGGSWWQKVEKEGPDG
jgi:hypothetical protein